MNALQAHSDRRSAREVTPADLSRLVAAANAGRYRDMERLAHELVGACRHSGVAWKALSASLEMQGKDSLAASERAAHLLPNDAEVYSNLGSALRRVGRLDESVGSYRRALAINPSIAEVWNNLGNALRDLGKLNDAVAAFRRALDLKPEFAKPYNNLGNALQDLGKLDEAVASYRRALELKPDYAEAHNNLAIALRSQNRTAEAESSCRCALQINPDLPAAITLLAELHSDKGRFAAAEELFRRVIAIEPESPEAWAGIAGLRKMTVNDAGWLAEAQRIAGQRLHPRNESSLRYAIGKYFDDVGDFEQAFINYRRANELTRMHRAGHDRAQVTQSIDEIISSFDRKWLNRARLDSTEAARPVFIVGMPRSGTTLAEQILASHRDVCGAGELPFWNTAASTYAASVRNGELIQSTLQRCADDYRRLLTDLSADALRVVDKMPGNFLYLGLIHAALPSARVIHLRRNPIDTCLSIYFQNFGIVHSYANDMADLAHYYGEYRRVMDHWRLTLPADTILEVPYEGLIEDQEAWSRRMLEFIGLPWDPACMDFHRTDRAVSTFSKWQARQKITGSSVGRWRNYEKFLGPLLTLAESVSGVGL